MITSATGGRVSVNWPTCTAGGKISTVSPPLSDENHYPHAGFRRLKWGAEEQMWDYTDIWISLPVGGAAGEACGAGAHLGH